MEVAQGRRYFGLWQIKPYISLETIKTQKPLFSLPPFHSLKPSSSSSSLHCDPPTMATPLTSFRPVSIRVDASASQRPDLNRINPAPSKWWTPLFGWSSDPDYITSSTPTQNPSNDPGSGPDPAGPRSRFALGCFTEEKAKQLRKKTLESSTFHDIMYHSAIASRLASDLSDK